MKIDHQSIAIFNQNLRYESPEEIVRFALEIGVSPIASTSFGTYSAAMLHLCVGVLPQIPIVWCDTGFNTPATYKHALELQKQLNLNLKIYAPKLTTGFLEASLGYPELTHPNFQQWSAHIKLEPFRRALTELQPDVWLTNIRKSQTSHREALDILSWSQEGILKVSPFFYCSDSQMMNYLQDRDLPWEADYFDPIKAMTHRECGIHLQ